ncbi:MAG: SpoIIE family protein phosphatase [Vulcanimicrobiaceae bacterium]
MASPAPHHHGAAPTRLERLAFALGLFLAILGLECTLPGEKLIYAQLIPLLYVMRACGRWVGVGLAVVSASLLSAFDYRLLHPAFGTALWSDAFVCTSIFVAVLFVVDRYDGLLERTYRSEAERRLAVISEERFRELAEHLPHFVWTQRANGPMDYVNARWLEYSLLPTEVAGTVEGMSRVIPSDDVERFMAHFNAALSNKERFEIEFRAKPDGSGDGAYRWFLGRVVPIFGHGRRIVKWIGSATDIHDRRVAELVRERDLAAIEEAIPHLVWRTKPDGSGEFYSPAWTEYTGLTSEELCSGGRLRVVHPEDVERVHEAWEKSVAEGSVFDLEFRMRGRRGEYRWFLTRATALRDANGTVAGWFGTCTDIDAQKATQHELERQFEVANRVADAFQVASLPTSLPTVPGVRFSAVYEAGRREASIGGDWYDALRLVDGRIVLSIGDVAGSGLGAAVTMSSVRQAIRGAAQIHADPLAILDAADRTLREDSPERMVTAFVAIFDPVSRLLSYASAGHPPPLVRRPDYSVTELRTSGMPLGVRRKGDSEVNVATLAPGSFVVLYTDGLTESTHDIAQGEQRLRSAVAFLDERDPAPARSIRRAVLHDGVRDDVAILTLYVEQRPENGSLHYWKFDSSDRLAARRTHASLTSALVALGALDAEVRDAELVFAELLGNVVRHAPGPVDVALDTSGTLPVLSILDRGKGFSFAPHAAPDTLEESGRGLFIIKSLTVDLNATRRPGGGCHVRAVLQLDAFGIRSVGLGEKSRAAAS